MNLFQTNLPFIGKEEIEVVKQIISSRRLSLFSGSYVNKYENALKNYFNVENAIAVSCGSAAIHSALYAIGLQENDEVLVPANAIILSLIPILYFKARPVFVDCQKNSIDFDYSDMKKKITRNTKAILPVYLWGITYDFEKLKNIAQEHSLTIIEDAAQAHGSTYQKKYLGTLGDIGCFSTFESKLICTGEGGFILTNNDKFAKRIRNFIGHGLNYQICNNIPKINLDSIGYNYRINELASGLGLIQLKKLKKRIDIRSKNAKYLDNSLCSVKWISKYQEIKNTEHNHYNSIYLTNSNNTRKLKLLYQKGLPIDAYTYNHRPGYCYKYFQKFKNKCPNAEKLLKTIFNIPVYENMTIRDMNNIISIIKSV